MHVRLVNWYFKRKEWFKKMKQFTKILYFIVAIMMLSGCFGNEDKDEATDSSENSSVLKSTDERSNEVEETTEVKKSTSPDEVGESDADDVNKVSSEKSGSTSAENSDVNADAKDGKNPISQYSSQQIEYARVWMQLGPNQEIDELNVRHIPVGEPINPNIDNSATFPEGVIQLSGSRLIDGSVTYKGNGDGTINVYNTPMRWSAPPPNAEKSELQKETEDILKNTKLVYIQPSDGDQIIKLIELQKAYN